MLGTLLILLGSATMLLTIATFIVFMIAGGFKRSTGNAKVLAASGIAGFVMLVLGGASMIYGAFVLHLAFTILSPILFLGLAILCIRTFEGVKVREYLRKEHAKPILKFALRICAVTGVILTLDVIGLGGFLIFKGIWSLFTFTELLPILLLLEGTLIGAGGAFMFYGYSEQRLMGQAALWPTLARDQVEKWRERRGSQQKWGFAMLIAGFLLVFLGLLTSFLASV